MHSESFDYVEYVDLQVELLLRILLNPVLALRFHSAAEAAS